MGSFPKIQMMAFTSGVSSVSAGEFVPTAKHTVLELALHQAALT